MCHFDDLINAFAMRMLAEDVAGRHVHVDAVDTCVDSSFHVLHVAASVGDDLGL